MSPVRSDRSYAGRSPDQRRIDRRRRLLEAALDRFTANGFPGTSITEVCRAAGVAPVQFYEEFTGRDALLAALYDEIVAESLAAVRAVSEGAPATVTARIRAGLAAFCHSLLDDPRRARIVGVEIVGVSGAIEARRREVLREFAGFVCDEFLMLESAGIPVRVHDPVALAVTSMALVGGVHEAMVDWLLEPSPIPLPAVVDALTELFLAAARHIPIPDS